MIVCVCVSLYTITVAFYVLGIVLYKNVSYVIFL